MKNLIELLERKDDTMVTIEPWADFLKVDLGADKIEYVAVKEVKDSKVKNLKVGESLRDEDIIWLCITDLEALKEK
jgi:hypothetical protein